MNKIITFLTLSLLSFSAWAVEESTTLWDYSMGSGGYKAIDALIGIFLLLIIVAMCRHWGPIQRFFFPFMDTLKKIERLRLRKLVTMHARCL